MEPTVTSIREGEAEARLEAILGMRQVQAPSAQLIQTIVEVLDDAHPGLRQAALEVVGHLANDGQRFEASVLDRIVDLTRDDSARVRSEAATALALVEDNVDHAGRLFALRRLLIDDDSNVRQEAAAALGDLADHESIDKLAACLDDRDTDVAFEAAFALARMQDGRSRSILENALRRPKRRLDAMKALGELGDDASVPALEPFTTRLFVGWADRLTAHATLYRLGRSASGDAILARTSARNFQERTYALSLLGSHGVANGADVLLRVAENDDDQLRDTAVRALRMLGEPRAVDCLLRIATNEAEPMDSRREATEALLGIDTPDAKHALMTVAATHEALAHVASRGANS